MKITFAFRRVALFWIVGCAGAGATVPGAPASIDLLVPGTAWRGNTDHASGARMTLLPPARDRLAVIVRADGGREDFPKLRRSFAPARDWRGFARLRVRFQVHCRDPEIRRKQIAFVFYDDKTRLPALPGRPMKQQVISRTVPVNQWIDAAYPLDGIRRSAVRQLDIYLYEDASGRPHAARWEIRRLELQRVPGNAVILDGELYGDRELSARPPAPVAGRVRTSDGLGMIVTRNGGVRLELDGKALGAAAGGRAGGFQVRDVAAGGPPRAAAGEVRSGPGGLRQRADLPGLGLRLEAVFRSLNGAVDVRGTVTDLRGRDRAVTVMFTLPLPNGSDWQWWDGPAEVRTAAGATPAAEFATLETGMHYGLHGRHSKYPLAALDFPKAKPPFGLSLAVRMDEPTVFRIAWTPRIHRYWIGFDFGLVPGKRADGSSLAQARFHFLLYRHDPTWGFRAALARYYRMFPEFFRRRVRRGGGWYVWGNMKDTPGALAAGLGLHWGPQNAAAVKWDNAHGVPALYYIESETYQQSMEDFKERPTCRDALERLNRLAAGDPRELEKVAKLPYKVYPLAASGGPLPDRIRETCRTVSASLSFDAGGRPYCSIGKRGWMRLSRWGAILACNLAPALPGGKGRFNLERILEPALKAMRSHGAHYDGIALDSFGGYGQAARADFRRSHFPYAEAPLSFSAEAPRPVQVAAFATVAWLRTLASEMHARGRILMANCSWGATPGWLTFAAPYLDVFGAEAPKFADPDFIRCLAFRKICTDLPYKPRPAWELPWHWLHGIYPGMGNDLAAMTRCIGPLRELDRRGWEPIPGARVSPGTLRLERFGHGETLDLVLHNPAPRPVEARIRLDKTVLGPGPWRILRMPQRVPAPARAGIHLAARETIILRLTREKP